MLLSGRQLYKTKKFKSRRYIGDAINSIRIFNDLCVDELIIFDIDASKDAREPDVGFLKELASECFVPFCYGGGIRSAKAAERIFNAGFEKISLNSAALEKPALLTDISSICGSQSVVASIDVKKNIFGSKVVYSASPNLLAPSSTPLQLAKKFISMGAGEIFLNSVDLDGTGQGYDLQLAEEFLKNMTVPLIICGGAAGLEDFRKAADLGVSGAAAGKLFVYFGKREAVLLNYPTETEILECLRN